VYFAGMVRLGTSGWSYPHWRGVFYPRGLPVSRELAHMASTFNSMEINRSFYSLLSPNTCQTWYYQTPKHFVFALKGSRFITHNKKLRDVDAALANFFASGPLALKEKLGPIVWQLPETLVFDQARLTDFLVRLPRTTTAAAALARKHDHRLKHGSCTEPGPMRRLRHAIEARHESFLCPAFARLARKHGVAIVASDSATWPLIEEITAGFLYLRLHGSQRTYASSYSQRELARWAASIATAQRGEVPGDAARISALTVPRRKSRDVYVYFDNDGHAHAPRNALALAKKLA
jgi:uncharacterized protein YecE (DUF72 family)